MSCLGLSLGKYFFPFFLLFIYLCFFSFFLLILNIYVIVITSSNIFIFILNILAHMFFSGFILTLYYFLEIYIRIYMINSLTTIIIYLSLSSRPCFSIQHPNWFEDREQYDINRLPPMYIYIHMYVSLHQNERNDLSVYHPCARAFVRARAYGEA